MDNRYKSISRIVKRQIPSWIRSEYPGYVNFIEHYYKWLELSDNVLYNIYNIPTYLDIDLTTEEFLLIFIEMSMSSLPKNIISNKKLMIKHIKEVYQSKGTEKAIKFLFKILYDEEIELYYPAETILRCSDGNFIKSTFIKTITYTNKDISGRKIFGVTSGASAIVEKVTIKKESITYDYIEISNIIGVFLPNEKIETRDNDTYYSNTTVGQISKVIINNPGTNYYVNELIYTANVAINNAILQVTDVDINGGILSVNVLESGYGYTGGYIETNINNKGADIQINIGGVYYDNGKFITPRGKLSSVCVLQDGFKNQEYSYVIKSNKGLNEYKDIIYQTTHPAGMLLIGQVDVKVNVDVDNSMLNIYTIEPTTKLTNLIPDTMLTLGAEDYNIVLS